MAPDNNPRLPDRLPRLAVVWKFLKAIFRAWSEDKPSRLAAALAYYSIFSIAPVLFIAVTLADAFVDTLAASDQLLAQLESTLGPETAQFVNDLVINVSQRTTTGSPLMTVIGFGALLYAASGLFTHLKSALNSIWHVPPSADAGPLAFIKNRLLAFAMVIGVGLLLILSTVAGVVFSVLEAHLDLSGINLVNDLAVPLGLATLSFAIIFKVVPDADVAWRDVWLGAALTAVLVEIGSVAVGFYLGQSNLASAFDAAGALAILLVAIYYFVQIFLFGAVFTRVYSSTFGSQRSVMPDGEDEAISEEKA
jgi:membrane protein